MIAVTVSTSMMWPYIGSISWYSLKSQSWKARIQLRNSQYATYRPIFKSLLSSYTHTQAFKFCVFLQTFEIENFNLSHPQIRISFVSKIPNHEDNSRYVESTLEHLQDFSYRMFVYGFDTDAYA